MEDPAFELYKENLNQAASDMVRPFCEELLEACSDKASPEVCALCLTSMLPQCSALRRECMQQVPSMQCFVKLLLTAFIHPRITLAYTSYHTCHSWYSP